MSMYDEDDIQQLREGLNKAQRHLDEAKKHMNASVRSMKIALILFTASVIIQAIALLAMIMHH